MPVQSIQFSIEDFVLITNANHQIEDHTKFDLMIKNNWREAANKNVMNYSVESIKSKILLGDFKIVAQLNPLREQKRRSPASILSAKQSFDPASFNFTQIKDEEILFEMTILLKKCKQLAGPVYIFTDHYAPGFIFNMENADIDDTVKNTMMLIDLFMKEEICHNVMITRGLSCNNYDPNSKIYQSVRVCIWARKPSYGMKRVTDFASALCEFSGHLPIYSTEAWDTISEEEVIFALNNECAEIFRSVQAKVKELFCQ